MAFIIHCVCVHVNINDMFLLLFLQVWDTRTRACTMELKECEEFISDMAIDKNHKLLLATSGEGTLTVFNIRQKKLLLQSELFDSEMLSLAIVKVK